MRRSRPSLLSLTAILTASLAFIVPAPGQTLLRPSLDDGELRIVATDLAILSGSENRDDLPCQVTPLDPRLRFDLQYQAGYRVTMPLKALAGSGNSLRVLIRVKPLDGSSEPTYFTDRFDVPAIEEDSKGEAALPGSYMLGPGEYKIDWLMRDRAEKVCASHWTVETNALEDFEELASVGRPYTVGPKEQEVFLAEPPVQKASTGGRYVKLIVNFTPPDPTDVRMKPYDLQNLVAMLRAISREPQIGSFSVIAFNMQEERVIFEEHDVSRINFPALGDAVDSIQGGQIEFSQLQDEESDTRFLSGLIQEHLSPQERRPDAVIFVGPKLMLERKISGKMLAQAGAVNSPVFYFVYNSNPRSNPWKDTISTVLKAYKGLEYTITLPKDLGKAMSDMMFRLADRQE